MEAPKQISRRRLLVPAAIGVLVLIAVAVGIILSRPSALVLTGIVSTDDVIVSPQIGGQLSQLLVQQGDVVRRDQPLAVLAPDELRADSAYFAHSEEGLGDQVRANEAALRYEEQQAADQLHQSEATLAATLAQQQEASANASLAKLTLDRQQAMIRAGAVSKQDVDQAQTAYDVAVARVNTVTKQVEGARAAVALAQSAAEQVVLRRNALLASERDQAAARAQTAKARVRLGYMDIRAPISGIVDVAAARAGEYVNAGQPIVTLINPDNLWVRADVEETYIGGIRLGDSLTVRLPSGVERRGAVFYRGADAGYATQRDVSRTKRDIRTFEIRIRLDNADRRLAVGMTAYVLLPRSALAQ